MVCIYCGNKTGVSNSRISKKTHSIWRRRECQHCKSIFTTRENVDYASALRVKSASGHLEPFLRDKLLISLYHSLSHRKTAIRDAESLCTTIIAVLLDQSQKGLLNTIQIIKITHLTLHRFDPAAATHYEAHHGLENRG